jgi:hypothetical protein
MLRPLPFPAVLLHLLLTITPAPAAPEIRWLPDHTSVEVTGLGSEPLPAADAAAEEWSRRFAIRTTTTTNAAAAVPPLLGKWTAAHGTLRFTPRFPFSPGLTYEATWQPAGGKAILSRHLVPKPVAPGTTVSRIHPGAGTVPENLLKFYLHFSAPMSGGDIYRHLHLRNNTTGKEVELPFLELAEELWNPDMTRLTVFIDPGRVKREVKPLEDIGPALVAGQQFTLTIDAAWPDAAGQPLKQSAVKKFRVTPPDRTPPAPDTWKLTPPPAGTRDPLRLTFPEPLDHALALRLLTIPDVPGEPTLSEDALQWTWIPAGPWKPGIRTLLIQPELEDLAGNSIAKPFEVDIAGTHKEKPRPAAKPVSLPFTIP